MGNSYYLNPLEFIVDTIFGLYILIMMLRFLLQWLQADFYNPISQFIIKATTPVLIPLQKALPRVGSVDLACIAMLVILQALDLFILGTIRGAAFSPGTLLFGSFAELLSLFINVFLFAIFIQVVLSWVNPGNHNPATNLIYGLTEPMLRPARKMLPDMGGLDLSPIAVMLLLQLSKMIFLPPLYALARTVG